MAGSNEFIKYLLELLYSADSAIDISDEITPSSDKAIDAANSRVIKKHVKWRVLHHSSYKNQQNLYFSGRIRG